MVGNKKDLEADKVAESVERVKQTAEQQHLSYHEVSAKTGEGIQELYSVIIDRLVGSTAGSTPTGTPEPSTKSEKGPETLTLKKPVVGEGQPAQQRLCC